MQQQEIISKKKSIRWVPRLLPLPFAAATSIAAASCSLPRVQQWRRRWLCSCSAACETCLRQREMPFNEFHRSLFWWQVSDLGVLVFCFFVFLTSQNDVVLTQLTAGHNWSLTKYQIDNNWKLEDWNKKDWKLEGQFYIFAFNKLTIL